MALKTLRALALPHTTPPFIPIFSFTPPPSIPFPCIQVVFYLLNPSLWFAERKFFSGVGSSTPRPTPNLEDQGVPFCLGHHP